MCCLLIVGFPVEDTPSHIIPIRIGDPLRSSKISDLLMLNFGHYIQAINYPTVARGEEKLRLAPTPFHNEAMMDQLVEDMKQTWQLIDLPLGEVRPKLVTTSRNPRNQQQQQQQQCKFEMLERGKKVGVESVRNAGHYATTPSNNVYI